MATPVVSLVAKTLAILSLLLTSVVELGSQTVSLEKVSGRPEGLLMSRELEEPSLPHVRKKRYVSFPSGSTFGITICLAKRTLIRYPDFYTFNFDLDVGYKLPNSTKFFLNRKRREETSSEEVTETQLAEEEEEASIIQHRRDRRALYSQVETLLLALGLDGRECVLRTICEAKQVLPDGGNLMEDVFRVLFTMPPLRPGMKEEFMDTDVNDLSVDPKEDERNAKEYDAAHALGNSNAHCRLMFPLCSVSLLEVALW